LPEIIVSVDVRERILIESGHLFGKYGIRTMTMDALAEEMGISKRTIYERFKDKDTLLLEVLRYYKEKTTVESIRLIEQSDNAIEALFRIIKMTVGQMQRMSPAFFHDFKKYHQNVFKQFAEPGEIRDMSMTRKLLETGVRQEVFKDDINMEIVNHAIHALFDLFGHNSEMIDAGFHRQDMFDHILIPYFRGISTKKGRKLLTECKTILE